MSKRNSIITILVSSLAGKSCMVWVFRGENDMPRDYLYRPNTYPSISYASVRRAERAEHKLMEREHE